MRGNYILIGNCYIFNINDIRFICDKSLDSISSFKQNRLGHDIKRGIAFNNAWTVDTSSPTSKSFI